MMQCKRCNNTHWVKAAGHLRKYPFAILRLHRPYKCIKCGRIQTGSIFFIDKWAEYSEKRNKRREALRKTAKLRCPKCGSEVRRSRRRGLELIFIFWRAFRCLKCRKRFWSLQS